MLKACDACTGMGQLQHSSLYRFRRFSKCLKMPEHCNQLLTNKLATYHRPTFTGHLPTCASLELFICGVMPLSSTAVLRHDDRQHMLTSVSISGGVSGISDLTLAQLLSTSLHCSLFGSSRARDDME